MYYKTLYNDHFAENNFKGYLRENKQGNSKKKLLVDFSEKPTKSCINTIQKSNRAFVDHPIPDTSDLTKKYEKKLITLKSSIDMFKPRSRTLTETDIKASHPFIEIVTNESKLIKAKNFANSKKLNFFYGNNPIEVLSDEKTSSMLNNEKERNYNKTKQNIAIHDSSKVKGSLDNFHLKRSVNEAFIKPTNDFYVTNGRPSTTKFNRKKNIVAVDESKGSLFYMN